MPRTLEERYEGFDERYKDLVVEAVHFTVDPVTRKLHDVQVDGIQHDGKRAWVLLYLREAKSVTFNVADFD